IVAGIWWRFRRWYPPATSDGWLLGLVAGIAGVAVWIALAAVPLQQFLPEALRGWIGGSRAAYNPLQAIENPAWAWGFIAVRMLGLAVVVPLMEEVFWRGFLLRYLIDEDFRSVPIGKLTPASFAIVTLAFTLVHP